MRQHVALFNPVPLGNRTKSNSHTPFLMVYTKRIVDFGFRKNSSIVFSTVYQYRNIITAICAH